jgi:hypothetical protein
MFSLPTQLLPYAQATATQRAQVLQYLQARLRRHFPTLPERPFARTLAECAPPLLLTGAHVALTRPDLTQLVQYLGDAPELPVLDPPLYGPWALDLAQYLLQSSELAVGAIVALAAEPGTPCVPQLWALLQQLATPYPLAERVVQARRWDLPGSPPLPNGPPGGGPAPASAVIQHLLHQLAPPGS